MRNVVSSTSKNRFDPRVRIPAVQLAILMTGFLLLRLVLLMKFGPPNSPWRDLCLACSADLGRPQLRIRVREAALSTSTVMARGRHILDPLSGKPCAAWGSVSVVAATGFEADLLATALFVMGPGRGLRWATAHRVAAIFLPRSGRVSLSPACRPLAPHLASPLAGEEP